MTQINSTDELQRNIKCRNRKVKAQATSMSEPTAEYGSNAWDPHTLKK